MQNPHRSSRRGAVAIFTRRRRAAVSLAKVSRAQPRNFLLALWRDAEDPRCRFESRVTVRKPVADKVGRPALPANLGRGGRSCQVQVAANVPRGQRPCERPAIDRNIANLSSRMAGRQSPVQTSVPVANFRLRGLNIVAPTGGDALEPASKIFAACFNLTAGTKRTATRLWERIFQAQGAARSADICSAARACAMIKTRRLAIDPPARSGLPP